MLTTHPDPTCSPVERIRAEPASSPDVDRATLKRAVAEAVRTDSRERRQPTAEHVIQDLASELSRDELGALLAEMATDHAFADIQAVVAPSGRIYLFSTGHLARNDAAARCFLEEAKIAIVQRIRQDSQLVALTPLSELDLLFPSPDPAQREELLAEIRADERFQDIQAITGADGTVHFHSDVFLSCNYGAIMMRARANDPGHSIAEMVRDRSRDIPAPTKATVFHDRVFGVSRAQLQAFVDELRAPDPAYADIKVLVHPTTGALYLYSDRWMIEAAAFRVMDWEEVGASQNP